MSKKTMDRRGEPKIEEENKDEQKNQGQKRRTRNRRGEPGKKRRIRRRKKNIQEASYLTQSDSTEIEVFGKGKLKRPLKIKQQLQDKSLKEEVTQK